MIQTKTDVWFSLAVSNNPAYIAGLLRTLSAKTSFSLSTAIDRSTNQYHLRVAGATENQILSLSELIGL